VTGVTTDVAPGSASQTSFWVPTAEARRPTWPPWLSHPVPRPATKRSSRATRWGLPTRFPGAPADVERPLLDSADASHHVLAPVLSRHGQAQW